eukprot:TRINITY_DN5233_c0_g1_i1.p1 TRINITY_DN5233_c0_g1~~TRINITY_DN5233_c0_g1_i1.p1  ORF type:complete len:73 (-),score=0.71 TRINITY_DN5233_c0_g1_i1:400-618(-)
MLYKIRTEIIFSDYTIYMYGVLKLLFVTAMTFFSIHENCLKASEAQHPCYYPRKKCHWHFTESTPCLNNQRQ